jgi:hypothetical protein
MKGSSEEYDITTPSARTGPSLRQFILRGMVGIFLSKWGGSRRQPRLVQLPYRATPSCRRHVSMHCVSKALLLFRLWKKRRTALNTYRTVCTVQGLLISYTDLSGERGPELLRCISHHLLHVCACEVKVQIESVIVLERRNGMLCTPTEV